ELDRVGQVDAPEPVDGDEQALVEQRERSAEELRTDPHPPVAVSMYGDGPEPGLEEAPVVRGPGLGQEGEERGTALILVGAPARQRRPFLDRSGDGRERHDSWRARNPASLPARFPRGLR